jgi:CheY-like chemotaxis protein
MATILLVEDNHDVREMMCVALGLAGHTVWTATHGLEALAILRHRRPDLVVLDLMMPIMNGWEFRTELNHDPKLRNIPVVVVSAVSVDVVERLGNEIYLPKPIDLDRLLDVVSEATGGAVGERRGA